MQAFDGLSVTILRLPDHSGDTAPWAVFDPDWYRTRYADVPTGPDQMLLDWYLAKGQTIGHSPNRYFDEEWQRRDWPGIQALIDAGSAVSAFDAWCKAPHSLRPPHWLFDPTEYRNRYPAVTVAFLAEAGFVNHYHHFLSFGAAERRVGHRLFDPDHYLANLDSDQAEEAALMPFRHYLQGLEIIAPERRTSPLFDPDWYRRQYPDVAGSRFLCLLQHYLCNDHPCDFEPSPWFSERYYLSEHPGLAQAIGAEGFRNGFAHFLAHGLAELRSPHPDLDLAWYSGKDNVRADIAAGLATDAFVHWITIGHPNGASGRAKMVFPLTADHAIALHDRRVGAILPLFGRHGLDFTCREAPSVSVIIPVGRDIARTMSLLASVRAQRPGDIELILIGDDRTPDIETHVTGATVLRFQMALTDAAMREAGLTCATSDAVLMLSGDLELAPGAISNALMRLNSDETTAAVGARLVQPDGTLFEAGNVIWRRGRLDPYARGASPSAPEANFVRDVDYCSTLFLLCRRKVLLSLPVQEDGIAGTTHDAADLCVRIQEAGYRVTYEPDALAFLTRSPVERYPVGQACFAAAHADYLCARPEFDPKAMIHARSPDRGETRILFVEDTIPLRQIGSGFVRSNDIVRAMAASGASVTVFPMNENRFPLPTVRAELPATTEVMHDRSAVDFADFIDERQGGFDVIWIARTHNLGLIVDRLNRSRDPRGPSVSPRIVVDTEAVIAAREAGYASLRGEEFDFDEAARHEFRDIEPTMDVVAVNDAEASVIRAHHAGSVAVLGHSMTVRPTPRPFEQRSGLLFVGAIHDMEHPNYDGLVWFIDEVLPLIERILGWETRLTVAGYTGPGVTLERFASLPRVTLRGAVADLEPLYDSHRVFVAPARFAAGIPYKVHEAAAFGLPVVATALLADQLGWSDGKTIGSAAAADRVGFAASVIALYRDSRLWGRLRETALGRVRMELNPDVFAAQVETLSGSRTPDRRSDSI